MSSLPTKLPPSLEPQPWVDTGFVMDRFVLSTQALAAWLKTAFEIRDLDEAMARIEDMDPVAEKIVIDGQAWRIPDQCYIKIVTAEIQSIEGENHEHA